MGFGDFCPLPVGSLLVFFVMAMVGVDDVEELANFVLEVVGTLSNILQFGICGNWRQVRLMRAGGLELHTFEMLLQATDFLLPLVHAGRY